MDIYEANGIVTIEKANAMIGELVSAVGTCGIGDRVEVSGLLTQVSPYPVVMVLKGKGKAIPHAVAKNTLKLIKTLPND